MLRFTPRRLLQMVSVLFAIGARDALVMVDATTDRNALNEARKFQSAIGLAGLIVIKLDGSSKGGIVVAIQDKLGTPTRFVGTGEQIDDFAPFDRQTYIDNLL
jgi:fused signal recognition particle receptor